MPFRYNYEKSDSFFFPFMLYNCKSSRALVTAVRSYSRGRCDRDEWHGVLLYRPSRLYQHHQQTGQVSQGVQQSNLVIMVGQNDPAPAISLTFNPNPVHHSGFLQLAEDNPVDGNGSISFLLFDIYGSLLLSKVIVQESTIVPMDKYPDGM